MSLSYLIENNAGAVEPPTIIGALGAPLRVKATSKGSSMQRDSLIWTNMNSHWDLINHYYTSHRKQGIPVATLLPSIGFSASDLRAHDGQLTLPPFSCVRNGPHFCLNHDGSNGPGLLAICDPSLSPARFAEPPCVVRAAAMGYNMQDINVSKFQGQELEDILLPILGSSMDLHTCKWIMSAVRDTNATAAPAGGVAAAAPEGGALAGP
jgi:hypothetical protein